MPAETVHGWRELNRAFAKADKDLRKQFRASERALAEPVRRDAETLAVQQIPRMDSSPAWARMRTGVTQKLVYVAPRKRSRDRRRRRPNLAPLLMDRAMQPALDRNAGRIQHDLEQLLDRMADDFNRGGTL